MIPTVNVMNEQTAMAKIAKIKPILDHTGCPEHPIITNGQLIDLYWNMKYMVNAPIPYFCSEGIGAIAYGYVISGMLRDMETCQRLLHARIGKIDLNLLDKE